MLMPRKKTPDLTLPLTDGGEFVLSEETNQRGVILCFYRGLHCPLCVTYLKELTALLPKFGEFGVGAVAISSDTEERAKAMQEKVGGEGLRFAYDLPLKAARDDWGLYISTTNGKTSAGVVEPDLFSEPGLFMIQPNQTLYYMAIQTMPFTRPHFSELVKVVDYAINNKYPARGEYDGAL